MARPLLPARVRENMAKPPNHPVSRTLAKNQIIRPRLARPARMVVDRCHASSVWRSSAVRWIMRDVFLPRGIAILPGKDTHAESASYGPDKVVSRGFFRKEGQSETHAEA